MILRINQEQCHDGYEVDLAHGRLFLLWAQLTRNGQRK